MTIFIIFFSHYFYFLSCPPLKFEKKRIIFYKLKDLQFKQFCWSLLWSLWVMIFFSNLWT